jgi:hypothetical protein
MGTPESHHKRFDKFNHAAKNSIPDRRWTIMFIGNHGRVITLKRFKGFVLLALFFLVLAVTGIVLLFWQSQNIIKERTKLQSGMDVLRKQIKDLSHEKDILMARLVLAEAKAKKTGDKEPEKKNVDTAAEKVRADIPRQIQFQNKESKVVAAAVNNKAANTTTLSQKEIAEVKTDLSVDVENFAIIHQTESNQFKIQFKVKNTTPNSEKVAGHTMVVLKSDELEQKYWLAIPPIALLDGKPSGKQRGHSFSINYFKTMRLSANVPDSPERYDTASVYVFTRAGELLLEKDFRVNIPAKENKTPIPSFKESPPKEAQSNSSQENAPSPVPESQPTESMENYPLF